MVAAVSVAIRAAARPVSVHGAGSWLREDGAVTTEYAVVVGVCAIVLSAALAALGPPLLTSYQTSRHTLIAPVP